MREAVYPVDYGYLEGTVAADGDGVDVFRGSAVGAGVVGFFVTADPGKRDVEVKVLIDCAAEEIERVRRLLDDVLGIGGLLVRRNLGAASGPDGPTAGEKPGAQAWQQQGR